MSISYALDIKIDSRIRDYVWNWFETILAKPSMILRIFAQTWKSGERRCITFILSLIPSAYRLSKSKWPAPIFPPLRQRGFRGMDATVHAIFRQFLPTADLSCIEEFLLLGTLWPRLVCSRCSRSRSRPKTVSISIGWNGPLLLLLLLLFLVVVLPLFRTFDGSTNGKQRKFVAGSLIFPIGLFSSNPKKFQRILLNARICFTTLDKKNQTLHFPPHILFRSTVPFSRFIPFFHVNFLQSLTFAPSSSSFRLIILFTILRNDASFLHSFLFKIFTPIVHQSRNFSPFFLFISTIFSRSTILSEKKERKRNVSSSSNSSRKSDHESSMLRFLRSCSLVRPSFSSLWKKREEREGWGGPLGVVAHSATQWGETCAAHTCSTFRIPLPFRF